jgi:hypothetical protein
MTTFSLAIALDDQSIKTRNFWFIWCVVIRNVLIIGNEACMVNLLFSRSSVHTFGVKRACI